MYQEQVSLSDTQKRPTGMKYATSANVRYTLEMMFYILQMAKFATQDVRRRLTMIQKIPTKDMSRGEWLSERRGSIGGSDAGAILGLNPYRSPYTVWAEKTGRLPEQEDNEAMRQGRDLEAYVANRFVEKSGKRVERYNYLLRNSEAPHLHANIDRRVIGERSGLECKTASALSLKKYAGGQFPESYYVQCVAYLAVTGWERWYLAVLVLNKAFYIYQLTTIPNDNKPDWCESSVFVSPQEIDVLRTFVFDFWTSYIIPDIPPPPDGSENTTETMNTIFRNNGDDMIELFGRESLLEEWERLKQDKWEIERRQMQIKQTIIQDMGQAGTGVCGDWRIKWTEQKRGVLSSKKLRKIYPQVDIGKLMICKNYRRFCIQKEHPYGTD